MIEGVELTLEALKRLWRNEYFQTAATIALLLLIVFGGYFGAQAALGTPYPALAVASGSMLPTLNIGDLIIVQRIDPDQINADPNALTGDILVYRRDGELIVHRAVKIEKRNGIYYITTRGDNSGVNDAPWPSTALVGKVIARIPYIGNLPLLLHSEKNVYILLIAFLVVLIILVLPPSSSKRAEQGGGLVEENPTPIKVNLDLIFYVIINAIIIGLIIFSLWGSYTFWQPGATPPSATIRGMYADLQYHKNFPNVYDAHLSQGFLTYRIDCETDSGTRLGVSTLAWYQLFTLTLIVFNAWKIHDFLRRWKIIRRSAQMQV